MKERRLPMGIQNRPGRLIVFGGLVERPIERATCDAIERRVVEPEDMQNRCSDGSNGPFTDVIGERYPGGLGSRVIPRDYIVAAISEARPAIQTLARVGEIVRDDGPPVWPRRPKRIEGNHFVRRIRTPLRNIELDRELAVRN